MTLTRIVTLETNPKTRLLQEILDGQRTALVVAIRQNDRMFLETAYGDYKSELVPEALKRGLIEYVTSDQYSELASPVPCESIGKTKIYWRTYLVV